MAYLDATELAREATEPRALACAHLGEGRYRLSLGQGTDLVFTVQALVDFPQGLPPQALDEVEITPARDGLMWPLANYSTFVPGLVLALTGSEAWSQRLLRLDAEAHALDAAARAMGQKGGQAKSAAKSAAARSNGLRGGRPSKRQV